MYEEGQDFFDIQCIAYTYENTDMTNIVSSQLVLPKTSKVNIFNNIMHLQITIQSPFFILHIAHYHRHAVFVSYLKSIKFFMLIRLGNILDLFYSIIKPSNKENRGFQTEDIFQLQLYGLVKAFSV